MTRQFDYQRFYDRIAPIYGPALRLTPPWRAYVRQVLPWLPAGDRILEIGPGPGVLLAELADRYAVAVGLDLSYGMLAQCQSRLRDAGVTARLVQGDAPWLPFRTASFDGIATTFAVSAIPEGAGAVREMARVLRPGGVLSLVDAGVPSDGNPIGVGLAQLWEQFGDYMRDEATLMRATGLQIMMRREFGAFNSIRLVVGRKPFEHEMRESHEDLE